MHLSAAGLLFVMATAAPPVNAILLDGQTHTGLLQQLTAADVELIVDGQVMPVAAGELHSLEFLDADQAEPYDKEIRTEVELVGGTTIFCTRFTSDSRNVTLESPILGEIQLPLTRVRTVRLGQWESKIDADWRELKQRESEQDLLIVRKGDALDFAGGVVGEIGEETITVLLGERELSVERERVFGFVFPREAPAQDAAVCELKTEADDLLRLQSIEMREESLIGTIVFGPEVAISIDEVQLIDFGLGRIRYLTELEPVASYEAVGLVTSEHVLKYRRVGVDNDPHYRNLVIGRRTFTRGLWIHSGSVLRYRLNRDFKRLQAVAGINRSSYDCAQFDPGVRVRIVADREDVLDEVITWGDEPRELDIDVEGVRDLEIHVTTTEETPLGICEHLALAEVRVIK